LFLFSSALRASRYSAAYFAPIKKRSRLDAPRIAKPLSRAIDSSPRWSDSMTLSSVTPRTRFIVKNG
jgi:hypothetical protein